MFQKIVVWTLAAAVAPLSLEAQSVTSVPPSPSSAVHVAYGNLPLTFEMNQGQTAARVKFLTRAPEYTAFLTSDGIALSLRSNGHLLSQANSQAVPPRRMLELKLVGATGNPTVVGEQPQAGQVNYFFGQDPRAWRTNVPTFGKVRYKDVYPGIDLVYYGNQRRLECDFEVKPGANSQLIQFEIQGASKLALDAHQNLAVTIGNDQLTFEAPTIYQLRDSQRTPVEGAYQLLDSTHIGFRLGSYDTDQTLVIDPVLVYSTYIGGSGDDEARGITVDSAGNAYVVGFTDSVDFPLTTAGSFAAGEPHVFVSKLNPAGSSLIYTDYIGGNNQDFGYALTLDQNANVWITGSTSSSNFPVVHAYNPTYPGSSNLFLAKISPSGSSLLYSTYLGGDGADVPASVHLDGSGNILIAGSTSSTNFPTVNAYQSAASPNQGGLYGNYGFLTKFTPDGSALAFSTYLGGSSNVPDNCGGTPCWTEPSTNVNGMALDASGNAYVAGITNTYDFPATAGAYLTSNSTQDNSFVGFVTKFTSSGNIGYSSYFYESSGLLTNVTALAVDQSGSAYLSGQAYSDGTFPVTNSNICDPATMQFACSLGFVTKFDPTGATLSYSTFLGPNNWATPSSITLDANDDAFVAADTTNGTYSMVNGLEPYSSGSDVLLVELDPTGTIQLWSTYLGGSVDESHAAITLDSTGNIYVTGITTSSDFPVSANAFQGSFAGNTDVFVTKIGPSSAPAVSLAPPSLQFGSEPVGSATSSQTVLLRNMGSSSLSLSSVASSGDFAQSNDCGTSLPAAGSCSFSVTFTPTAPGSRSGSITLSDDASGSPHTITLAGIGVGGLVSPSPASLSFAATPVGGTSAPQTLALTNSGNMSVSLSSIQVSGSYSQTNNCGASITPSSSCSVNIAFTPAATGTSTGALTVIDNGSGSPHSIPLTGVGSDFGLAAVPTTATVKSGSTTTYQLTVSSIGGSFSHAVSLTCTPPAKASCTISPVSVTPGQTQGTAVLTVNAASSTSAETFLQPKQPLHFALGISISGFAMIGLFIAGGRKNRGLRLFPAFVAAVLVLFLVGCAGGTGIISQGGSGTPPGTYTVTVAGTAGNLQHSLPLTLVVQ
ncbi:MAG TPA: SBBP repeat-containing protein [Candidatus Sulfotelmatobacter sp.]|nr:SBBP repeat-containing protein [Candidatus Sulfotelmatobacter sp.]